MTISVFFRCTKRLNEMEIVLEFKISEMEFGVTGNIMKPDWIVFPKNKIRSDTCFEFVLNVL